jgi:hypothetical protein
MAEGTVNRKQAGPNVCGWCLGAPLCAEGPKFAHDHCHNPDSYPCACAAVEHKLKPHIAERMALYCNTDVDTVYTLHGRKRRILTAEQKAELDERLAHARAVKAAGATTPS